MPYIKPKQAHFQFLGLLLVFALYSPLPTEANTTDVSTHTIDVFNISEMTEAILNSSLTSSYSTEFLGPVLETSSSTPIETIESSTTTLSIEAPFIKQWQTIGGLTKTLTLNTKDDQVLLLQGALKGLVPEFKPTYITSFFGVKTQEAVKLLQKKYDIEPNGVVGPKTRSLLNEKYFNDLCPQKNGVTKIYENINRTNSIPLDYTPSELVKLTSPIRTAGIICLSKDPASRLTSLFTDAHTDGIQLMVISGYRRPEIQKLLNLWSSKNNKTSTLDSSTSTNSYTDFLGLAEEGHSEHQLGTTVDFSAKSQGYIGPSNGFGRTPEGKWLKENSYKYGFIMSYPEGKESVTGYIYEPWHFRYVGVDTAKDIYLSGLSIQEYFDELRFSDKN